MDKFEKQKYANILAFLTAEEYAVRKKVLENVCRAFEGTDITWAIAMSCSIFFRGITDDFNDFDILIDINDVEKFEQIFKRIGGIVNDNTIQKASFSSPYYKEATLNGLHFDLIGDMTVNTFGKNYKYVLQRKDVEYRTIDGGLTIPLAPVEANYLLYAMMIGWQSRRIFKKDLCLEYLSIKGLKHKDVFERILTDNVDDCVTKEILENVIQLLEQFYGQAGD